MSGLAEALARKAAEWGQDRPSRWETPGDLAQTTNARTVQTPALDIIDEALVKAFNTPDSRLIISMAPQEGKSVRVAGDFPTWWLTKRPDARIVCASYSSSLAIRNGRAIRRRIQEHDLGIQVAQDNGSVSDWTLAGYDGGVLSVGVGSGLTGRPADVLIIDDPIKDRAEAESEVYRENVWDWWTHTASARLAPGAPVVLILTRWHHDDLAGRLLGQGGDPDDPDAPPPEDDWDVYDPYMPLAPFRWTYLNIPAQADHDPRKGQTDLLARLPGEFMESARRRTPEQWENRKKTAGPHTWASLYQGRPVPGSGGLFPSIDQVARYSAPIWVTDDAGRCRVPGAPEMIQSWDMAFKDTSGSDYVVGQVWLRVENKAYLLDQVRRRMSFTATLEAVKGLSAKWPQAVAKFVEDKANGPAVINALNRQINGLIPIEPEGSKYSRAAAVSPLFWAKDVVLPEPSVLPSVQYVTLEMEQFPAGAHDDTIDAMSQALNRLLLNPINEGMRTFTSLEELFGFGADDPHAILAGY